LAPQAEAAEALKKVARDVPAVIAGRAAVEAAALCVPEVAEGSAWGATEAAEPYAGRAAAAAAEREVAEVRPSAVVAALGVGEGSLAEAKTSVPPCMAASDVYAAVVVVGRRVAGEPAASSEEAYWVED
jgi:hypothetical protein